MDKRLWLVQAETLDTFGHIDAYCVRMYAIDAGDAWITFTRSFDPDTSWQFISVQEVKRSEEGF